MPNKIIGRKPTNHRRVMMIKFVDLEFHQSIKRLLPAQKDENIRINQPKTSHNSGTKKPGKLGLKN